MAVSMLVSSAFAQEQTPAQKAEIARAKVRIEMVEVNRQLAAALSAGRVEQIGDCLTEDAALLPPNARMVAGRAAVVAYFKALLDTGKLTVQVKSLVGSFDGALGYDAGAYSLVIDPTQGSQARDVGKYVTILRKEADGRWRIALDMWNSDAVAQ